MTRADHSVVVLDAPHVVGDTLKGTSHGAPEQFLLSQIAIQAREAAPARTAALVSLGWAAIIAGAVLLETSAPSNPCEPICPVRPGCPGVPCPSLN